MPPEFVLTTVLHVQALQAWQESRAAHSSVVSDLFEGQLQSSLRCDTCHDTSYNHEVFQDLSLPLLPRAELSIEVSPDRTMQMQQLLVLEHTVQLGMADRACSCQPCAVAAELCLVQDCLKAFTASEELDGEECHHCERCKARRPSTKALRISRCPPILVLHLKRFSLADPTDYLSPLEKVCKCVVPG